MDPSGFEPEASSLQGRRSNPDWATGPVMILHMFFFYKKKKGGDPAVGSPTATLWRLNPPHRI